MINLLAASLLIYSSVAAGGQATHPGHASSTDPRESVFKIMHPVVDSAGKLVLDEHGKSVGTVFGTGFLTIAPDGTKVVLTNQHVCGDSEKVTIYSEYRGFTSEPQQVLATDPDADICAVDARSVADYPVLVIPGWTEVIGEGVAIIGHPGGGKLKVTRGTLTWGGMQEFGSNARAIPGNSGSPALDDEGSVLGMVLAYNKQNKNSIAIRGEILARFLQRLLD